MTNEGAIEKLTAILNTWDAYNDEEMREAVEMAIEALEREHYKSIMGYDLDEVMYVAMLLRQELITPDDLHLMFEDSKWMYAKIKEQFDDEIRKAMNSMVTTIGKDEVSVKIGGNNNGVQEVR